MAGRRKKEAKIDIACVHEAVVKRSENIGRIYFKVKLRLIEPVEGVITAVYEMVENLKEGRRSKILTFYGDTYHIRDKFYYVFEWNSEKRAWETWTNGGVECGKKIFPYVEEVYNALHRFYKEGKSLGVPGAKYQYFEEAFPLLHYTMIYGLPIEAMHTKKVFREELIKKTLRDIKEDPDLDLEEINRRIKGLRELGFPDAEVRAIEEFIKEDFFSVRKKVLTKEKKRKVAR